jgi:[ribosomal protein S18]-alanine N-acetyltransferase
MTPEDLARIHALSFTNAPPPWSAEQFAALLATPGTIAILRGTGLAIGRVAGPEAELLTLAVAPEVRRTGLARTMLAALEARAAGEGARELFLEVAVTNHPARALYADAGFREAGRRPGYYTRRGAPAIDALVLRKVLSSEV